MSLSSLFLTMCHSKAEMQKVKTFTLAAFWGPKNLRQKCVIRDKFNAIKSAWFATNWILKMLKKHYLCSKFKKKPWNNIQSAKNLQFMNIYTQNCVIRDKVIFLHHHLSRSPSEFLHQLGLFYTSSVSTVSTFLHLCFYPWYIASLDSPSKFSPSTRGFMTASITAWDTACRDCFGVAIK